jgi:hypothetical protein
VTLCLYLLQFIGSSLLFIHDEERVGVWLIDFGKTVPLPEGVNIDHNSVWEVGNHEDGYKIGVDNLVSLFSALAKTLEEEEAGKEASDESATTASSSSTGGPGDDDDAGGADIKPT